MNILLKKELLENWKTVLRLYISGGIYTKRKIITNKSTTSWFNLQCISKDSSHLPSGPEVYFYLGNLPKMYSSQNKSKMKNNINHLVRLGMFQLVECLLSIQETLSSMPADSRCQMWWYVPWEVEEVGAEVPDCSLLHSNLEDSLACMRPYL